MSPTETLADPIDVMGRLLSFEGKQNPYPLYEQMRAHGPVVDVGGVHLFVTGHAECARALREPDLLSTDASVQDVRLPGWREHASWVWLTRNMLFANDPDHERYRRFFASAFSARSVENWRPMVERRAADTVEHVARLAAGGEPVDLVAEFSFRMAVGVIGELLGIPDEDHAGFRSGVGDITLTLEPIRDMGQLTAGDAAMERFAVYFHDLVARRRAHPASDLTSAFVKARDAAGELSETELVANLMLLLVAATEAPQDLLSNMVRLALEHPGEGERLRADEKAAAGFVDETLRFEPAAQILNRVAARDLEFFGVKVAKGVPLTLLIAAGNRDPRRFTDPGVFDPARADNSPLTFSGGAHFCLGAALARMSAETVVPLLLRRLPALRLAGPATFRDQIVQRGHGRLLVTAG